VLDMGEPIRIDEVARRVSETAPVPIVYTGLRPGEKLHEQLLGAGEIDERPVHPLISHVPAPPLSPAEVYMLDPSLPRERIVADLRRLAFAPAARRTGASAPSGSDVAAPHPHAVPARSPGRPGRGT
jgi:hypothetical protein